MTETLPSGIFSFARELLVPEKRTTVLREGCAKFGIEALLVFIPDPELKVLLVAPGFAQTVPGGAVWRPFLAAAVAAGETRGKVPWPNRNSRSSALAISEHGYAMVLLGPEPAPEIIRGLKQVLPFIGVALAAEKAARAQQAQAHFAAQMVQQANALSQRLDEARRSAGREIAARSRAETELREARDQLAAANEALERRVAERTASLSQAIAQMEEFSYSVSHDLRTPLRAMIAYADALVSDYSSQLDSTARSYLERIKRASLRMEELTHAVLTYSRTAQTELLLAPVRLSPLLEDLITEYAAFQPPAASLEIIQPLADVMGHELSLGQCVTNLLSNAVKFVEPGVHPHIRIYTENRDDRVRLVIEDNGIGIDPKYHGRLFRMFERINPKATVEGTGIGLAIVRKAVERMGGKAGVDSDGKKGSRFWIELQKA